MATAQLSQVVVLELLKKDGVELVVFAVKVAAEDVNQLPTRSRKGA
jgi:hypothetical protein